MSRKYIHGLFIVLGILLLLFFFKKNTVKKITGTHVVTFYDEKSFLDGIAKVKSSYKEKDYKIKGGIVPHHLLPSYIVADFFKHIAHQKPKTLILIGPNHYEKGTLMLLQAPINGKLFTEQSNLILILFKNLLTNI
jgi:hypothetical protein